MIERIRAFLNGGAAPPEADLPKGVAPEELRIAACALLLEVAYADDYFSLDERRHLRSLVRRHFGLKPEAAEELIALADDERRNRVDMWSFTALIRDNYSVGQKMVLAEAMWGLVLADGDLAGREDYIMRKISGLLALKPGYLSEARKRHESAWGPGAAREHRSAPDGTDANNAAAGSRAGAEPGGVAAEPGAVAAEPAAVAAEPVAVAAEPAVAGFVRPPPPPALDSAERRPA